MPCDFFDKGRIDDFPYLCWICNASGLCQDIHLKCPVTRTMIKEHLYFILDPFFVRVGKCSYCVLFSSLEFSLHSEGEL